MNPAVLALALIRWAEAIRRRSGTFTGRRAARLQDIIRVKWLQRALGDNRAERRKKASLKRREEAARKRRGLDT